MFVQKFVENKVFIIDLVTEFLVELVSFLH